jgi:hypothetical protein
MPRYDLMHWSQRVRDQQAASAGSIPVGNTAPASTGNTKPGAKRQRPERDPTAEHLLRLCRDGRLFELQFWVAEGKPLTLPSQYRYSLLRISVDTGFHSLIEFLLQHEKEQARKDEVLREACWRDAPALMRLALDYGAAVDAIPFQDVIETWDRDIVQLFLDRGADVVTNVPFARAFKRRIKAILGIFLDCKRARPDLAAVLQEQADMALRQACQEEDLKWVSLLMWLGADPRSKGLPTDYLEDKDIADDPTSRESALQIACASRKLAILQRLKPDPTLDNLSELMAAAASIMTTPETVAYLVKLGANINDKADGGSTVLNACLRHFGWRESVWDAPYGAYRQRTVPVARLGHSLGALEFLLKHRARWTPDERSIGEARRSLYRIDGEGVATLIDLLRTHRACSDTVLHELVKTPKMRAMLKAADKLRAQTQRRPEPPASGAAPAPKPKQPRLFHARYNRQRLYEEVWAEPAQLVAKRYGVSDAAIAKGCKALGVPKPPRGYWAKKAAGRKVPSRPPLPNLGK